MALTPEGTPYVESTDLVANYPAASLSLANRVDLVGVLPFATSTARGTAIPSPTDGQYTYLQDTNATEFWNGTAWQALGGGKILQVVRATDTTNRSTTSTSFVDVTGMSVTITPQKSTSAIIILANFNLRTYRTSNTAETFIQITDASNNAISGSQNSFYTIQAITATQVYNDVKASEIAYATPGTTSAVTYKLRFRIATAANSGEAIVLNNSNTGQMYAIEVAA